MPPRPRRPQEPSRESILREASRVFRTKGYRGATLAGLANQFGISRPALYHYFKSKREILFAIYREVSASLQAGAAQILAEELGPVEKFHKVVRHHIRTVLENAQRMGVYYDEEAELSPAQRREVRAGRRRYSELLIDLYARGVESGDFADVSPTLAVYVILGACNWSYKWFDPAGESSVEQTAQLIERLVLNGYVRGRQEVPRDS